MKNLLFSICFFSLILAGCKENSINDPVSNETINKTQNPEYSSGTIPLEDVLVIPGLGNSYYSVNGQIDYTHEIVLLDPVPPAPQYYVSLHLSVNAVLTDLSGQNSWVISEEAQDIFYVSEEGIYLLVKSFTVQENKESLQLICRFLITTDGVDLNAIWLSSVSKIPAGKMNNEYTYHF